MKTFAGKVIAFNQQLDFKEKLPEGIRIMNPFKENKTALEISSTFYKKYYFVRLALPMLHKSTIITTTVRS